VNRPIAFALALLLAGCGGQPAAPAAGTEAPSTAADAGGAGAEPIAQLPQGSLEAVALEVGVALDADGRVAAVVERVRPGDAVHASLVTVGESKAAMLAIAWRDASGTEIDADERAITASGPAVHTFTRQLEGGWAPGRYEVEVRVDGESAGVRSFEVR
jgi:hypothetical protein